MRHDFDLIDRVDQEAIPVRRHSNPRMRELRGKATARFQLRQAAFDLLGGAIAGLLCVAALVALNGGFFHG